MCGEEYFVKIVRHAAEIGEQEQDRAEPFQYAKKRLTRTAGTNWHSRGRPITQQRGAQTARDGTEMRYARKKDTNHNEIFSVLRQVGAVVKETYQFPAMLDGIVAYRGALYWADVKHGKADLTEAERALIEEFARAGVTLYVWRTADEALQAIGAI